MKALIGRRVRRTKKKTSDLSWARGPNTGTSAVSVRSGEGVPGHEENERKNHIESFGKEALTHGRKKAL